jgi:hypothetical protein
MSGIVSTLELKRLNLNSQVLEKRVQPMRSWTRHFFDLWYELLACGVNTLAAITDITGAGYNMGVVTANGGPLANLIIASPPGGAKFLTLGQNESYPIFAGDYQFAGDLVGIQAGTNNAAVTPTDNALGTRIAHGSAATQLEYGGTEVLQPVFADPNGSMIIRRYFTNNSGGGITVEEVGIYAVGFNVRAGFNQKSTNRIWCIAHDVTGGVAVADTEILEVTYTVGITV